MNIKNDENIKPLIVLKKERRVHKGYELRDPQCSLQILPIPRSLLLTKNKDSKKINFRNNI